MLGTVLRDNPDLRADVLASTLADLPIIGTTLRENLGTLPQSGPLAIVGLVTLTWAALSVGRQTQGAMADLWSVPADQRPGPVPTAARAAAAGVIAAATALLSGAPSLLGWPGWTRVVVVAVVMIAGALGSLRVLTPVDVGVRQLAPGGVAAGLAWTGLVLLGATLVNTLFSRATDLYGFFGLILGFTFWLSLGVQASLLSAAANVVLAERSWPRPLAPPDPPAPPTPPVAEGSAA